MDTRFWLSQAFNGISYGALLFLVGSGLSLIFGVMRIVNLAHGSYFLLGSYVALSVIWTTGSWLLAIPAAAVAIGLLGLAMERVFLRPLGFDPLRQVLLTVGFALLFQQAALDIWGGDSLDITPPAALTQSIVIGGLYLPLYRVFMIGIAAAIGLILWLGMEKTRIGAAVRATVDDAEMARGVGIDTSRVSMFIFALGALLAALGLYSPGSSHTWSHVLSEGTKSAPIREMSTEDKQTCSSLLHNWTRRWESVEATWRGRPRAGAAALSAARVLLGHKPTRRGRCELLSASHLAAGAISFWRMSGHPAVQQALRNHYFDSLGLPRLHVSVQA